MKLEDFTSEMLDEIKSAKDLVKGELPELAKEYIRAHQIGYTIGLIISVLGIIIGLSVAYYGWNHEAHYLFDNTSVGCYIVGGLLGLFGLLGTIINGFSLMDVMLQPRRTAIRAITSLKD